MPYGFRIPLQHNTQGEKVARIKTLLLEAAIAIEKVLEVGGTIEQVLETLDQVQDIPNSGVETR